jgi:hypothetical protein
MYALLSLSVLIAKLGLNGRSTVSPNAVWREDFKNASRGTRFYKGDRYIQCTARYNLVLLRRTILCFCVPVVLTNSG